MTTSISLSVGVRRRMQTPANVKVPNKAADQAKIIDLLANIGEADGGKKAAWAVRPLCGPDGDCPRLLSDAIWDFQNFWLNKGIFHHIDGVIDPNLHTLQHMNDLASGGFTLVPPEGQLDTGACWAASLAWMTRAKGNSRSQLSILAIARVGTDGTITANELMTVSLAGIFMKRDRITPAQLQSSLEERKFPMLIGFSSGPFSGHVNVIHGYDETKSEVTAMEPWFPDPSKNMQFELVDHGGLQVYENKATHLPFVFSGSHVRRSVSHYLSKPLDGQFIIGRINP